MSSTLSVIRVCIWMGCMSLAPYLKISFMPIVLKSNVLAAGSIILTHSSRSSSQSSSSSRMRVINHNWSAMKQRLHPQSVAEISRRSVLSGDRIRQCETSSGFRHKDRSVSVSRHFLLQAPQCLCSVRKRFSRDHCCRGRSKPGCRIVGSHTR